MPATLTLELDDALSASLTSLTASWHVPPQEAVKRALSAAAEQLPPAKSSSALESFRQLQAAVNLTQAGAIAWKQSVSDARR